MVEITKKYICDRCGKASDKNYVPKGRLAIKKRIFKWNSGWGQYEYTELCKECAASFDKWWNGGEEE